MRVDGYAAIRDYALVGDGRTAALVARDGSIDWLCAPDLDSPSVFACVLDAERGGGFQLAPAAPFESERRYLDRSNVLETTFTTADGVARVTDALTLGERNALVPERELVRQVEGVAGSVELRWRVEPRFGYGGRRTRLVMRGGRPCAEAGPDALSVGVWGGEVRLDGEAFAGDLRVEAGARALLQIGFAHGEPLVYAPRGDVERRLRDTIDFWPRWVEAARYDGPWRELVLRSLLVLKLLVFAPSGAIVAAPTTSLPEWIGGERNWDYRFCWVRDASWTLHALLRLGFHDEANAFFWWLMHASRLTQPRLQILYRIDGSVRSTERELPGLGGYRHSGPVRIGNGAAHQVQLDVYGDLLEAIWLYVDSGNELDRATGREVARIADYVAGVWSDRDSGIWEVRSGPAHFIQSKALCWVALDRACRLAKRDAIPQRHASRWRAAADEIRAFVDEHGWDAALQSYVRAPDQRELDASLLVLPILGYDRPDAERPAQTVDAVRRELAEGPLVYRYRGEDGVQGGEGAFLTCSFWLVDALARGGRVEEACALMDELAALANDVGLYAEEVEPRTGAFLGNFPQGLSHLALVNAAVAIADAERSAA